MYEYKSDMETALHALMDEVEGVAEYKWMAENCQDPELKAIAQKVMSDEKQHATLLLQWINKNAAMALK
jgi:uncharacterized protein